MADADPYESLMPSFLDRLTNPDSGGTRSRPGYPLERMVESVQRDLEDLLNTRQTLGPVPARYQDLEGSLLRYGLPDLADLPADTPQDREDIRLLLQDVVGRFEGRLSDVRVVFLEDGKEDTNRSLKFRIEAHLRLDPAPPVAFETVLELATGRARVRPSGA